MRLAAAARQVGRLDARLLDHLGGRERRRRAIGDEPASVLLDADGNRLEPIAVEVLEDRGGRGDRDFVLARAAAVDDADAEFLHARRGSRPQSAGAHLATRARIRCGRCRAAPLIYLYRRPRPAQRRHTHHGVQLRVAPHRRPRTPRRAAHAARRRADAGVHAGRHTGRGQGADARAARGRRARRSCSGTPITCTCGPAMPLIARRGGLHRFIGWTHPILTDSGGYQVFSLSGRRTLTEEGVTFQLAPRRQRAPAVARACGRHPGAARLRHRDDVRRVPVVSRRTHDAAAASMDAHAPVGAPRPRPVPRRP